MDSPNFGCGDHDGVRPFTLKKRLDCGLPLEVHLRSTCDDDLAVFVLQAPRDGTADHPAMAGDPNPPTLTIVVHSRGCYTLKENRSLIYIDQLLDVFQTLDFAKEAPCLSRMNDKNLS